MLKCNMQFFLSLNSFKITTMSYIKTAFLFAAIIFSVTATAQRTAAKPAAAKTVGIKPPKLTTFIGNFKDSVISVRDAEAAAGMALKITDDKGVAYQVSSYQFLYKQIVATEDEQTGRVSLTTSNKSSLFKVTPLPPLWVNTIRENIKPGEQFIFFSVIAKDAQGRVFYAPDLKITFKP